MPGHFGMAGLKMGCPTGIFEQNSTFFLVGRPQLKASLRKSTEKFVHKLSSTNALYFNHTMIFYKTLHIVKQEMYIIPT